MIVGLLVELMIIVICFVFLLNMSFGDIVECGCLFGCMWFVIGWLLLFDMNEKLVSWLFSMKLCIISCELNVFLMLVVIDSVWL